MAGFEGAGYVTGYGTNADANTRFVVSVLDDGMYDVTIRYASGYGTIQIDHDRKPAAGLSVSNTNGQWEEATLRMFLRTGINLVDIQSNTTLHLDRIQAAFVNKDAIFSIEAEDAVVAGTPAGARRVREICIKREVCQRNYLLRRCGKISRN